MSKSPRVACLHWFTSGSRCFAFAPPAARNGNLSSPPPTHPTTHPLLPFADLSEVLRFALDKPRGLNINDVIIAISKGTLPQGVMAKLSKPFYVRAEGAEGTPGAEVVYLIVRNDNQAPGASNAAAAAAHHSTTGADAFRFGGADSVGAGGGGGGGEGEDDDDEEGGGGGAKTSKPRQLAGRATLALKANAAVHQKVGGRVGG